MCFGDSAECPANAPVSVASNKLCRKSQGICDIPEYCDGTQVDCPADTFKAKTVECRASAGDCDVGGTARCAAVHALLKYLLPYSLPAAANVAGCCSHRRLLRGLGSSHCRAALLPSAGG